VSFVTDLCPTLIALDFGRLIGDGPSERVLADPQVRRAFLGIADEEG
jgi:ABC-type branched-subunit amino acid transport system ATPase component